MNMAGKGEALTAALEDEVGDALRVVGRFTADDYELLYDRDDVRSQYTAEEIDEIHREQVFEELNRSYQEGLFEDVGELRCTTRWFDDIVAVLLMPEGSDRGVFVTVDRNDDLDVDDLVARCMHGLA